MTKLMCNTIKKDLSLLLTAAYAFELLCEHKLHKEMLQLSKKLLPLPSLQVPLTPAENRARQTQIFLKTLPVKELKNHVTQLTKRRVTTD